MFKPAALIAALLIAAQPLAAQGAAEDGADREELVITEAAEQQLSDFLWIARLVVVFADSPADPRFIKQMEYLEARPEDLVARDVIVITDTAPSAKTPIREALRPRGFDFVLIGKDGAKYLRKPQPWSVREITRSIDKMPDRQQELEEERRR